MSDYRSLQWGCHRHGAAAEGVHLAKQQINRAKRRTPKEVKAIAKAFDCSLEQARAILKAAQRDNARAKS
jgi:hypothetical protein